MSQAVHDMTGRVCNHCGRIFKKDSFNLTISTREKGFIVKKRVCKDCHHKHHEQGE